MSLVTTCRSPINCKQIILSKAPVSGWLCLRVLPALSDPWSQCISRVRAEHGQTLTPCYGDHRCFLNAWFRKWFGHSFDLCPRVSFMPHCPPLVSQFPVAGLDSHLPSSTGWPDFPGCSLDMITEKGGTALDKKQVPFCSLRLSLGWAWNENSSNVFVKNNKCRPECVSWLQSES